MDSDGHTTRTLLTSKLYSDVLLVSRGSNGNLDMDAKDLPKGKSMIKAFSLSKTEEQDFATQGSLLGWGLRNSVGMGEDSRGGLWAVENSADDLVRERVDIHQNNPAEELNFLGHLNESALDQYYDAPNYGMLLRYVVEYCLIFIVQDILIVLLPGIRRISNPQPMISVLATNSR